MKVGLDATPLTVPLGGIARYTRELFSALCREFPNDTFELVEPGPGRWWSYGLPLKLRREGFDVFHGTDFAAPYVPVCPAVMTVHDLSPWKLEPWRAASDRVRRRTPWLLRLGFAERVVTPTEAVRREAIAEWGLSPDRVTVVPEAACDVFRPGRTQREGFLLCVGTGARKNLDVAREAARRCGRDLVIVGRGEREASDEELADLCRRTAALLYPSFYEGFGLPILEAMQCGCPVIAARDPALMEVAGGAALHVDARDVDGWVDAVRVIAADPESWSRQGLARAAQFSWRKTAHQMHALYREVLR